MCVSMHIFNARKSRTVFSKAPFLPILLAYYLLSLQRVRHLDDLAQFFHAVLFSLFRLDARAGFPLSFLLQHPLGSFLGFLFFLLHQQPSYLLFFFKEYFLGGFQSLLL